MGSTGDHTMDDVLKIPTVSIQAHIHVCQNMSNLSTHFFAYFIPFIILNLYLASVCCTDWSGSWDSSMANDFFAYSAAKGHKIYAYEFGNELTGTNGIEAHISAQQYAQDFIVFADLVRMYFGQVGKVPGAPRLVTPDGTFNATYLNTFLDLLPDGYKPDILTHHLYSLGAGMTRLE